MGGYTAFDEINFDALPDAFVLKTNHGSGTNVIVRDKKKFCRSAEFRISKAKFDAWMQMDFGFDDGLELHYSMIERKIFAEAYVPALSELIKEYRVLCCNGEPHFIKVKTVIGERKYRNVYDLNWNPIPVSFGFAPYEMEPKPDRLDEMLAYAKALAKGFAFVRVDFNNATDKLYFGEMTFTSGSGFTKIEPIDFDYELGSLIHLPSKT